MLRRSSFPPPYDEISNRFRRELTEARETIISLMPKDMAELLGSYHRCMTRDETHEWTRETNDRVIASAKLIPMPKYFGERAYCPLCGGGSMSAVGSEGFSVPEGLSRHLTGWGNARQCEVMAAATALAREYWNEKFREAEEAEEAAKQTTLVRRRATETLYRVAPDLEPELVDSGRQLFGRARTSDEFNWAEERLKGLGFEIHLESNVRWYVLTEGDFSVYADPRTAGRIDFAVFPKTLPKRRRPTIRLFPTFHLRDEWVNNIGEKFRRRLAEATTQKEKR